MENNWVEEISIKIDRQAEKYLSVKDYRFYQIGKLKRIAKLLDQQRACLECKYAKVELECIIDELDRLINQSGVNRSEYEKRVEKILNHLKTKHGVYQIHHFTYTYSTIYTLGGVVFGLFLTYGLFYSFNPAIFFLCAGVGMIVGNVLGNRKDKEYKRKGKQL
ncbi:hypothetical protein [Marinifilum sp.]|uniref:hypothetical protein n=1 Tax=Marinifilum sp. TaxID=2033137 RepID=UPI003BAC805E